MQIFLMWFLVVCVIWCGWWVVVSLLVVVCWLCVMVVLVQVLIIIWIVVSGGNWEIGINWLVGVFQLQDLVVFVLVMCLVFGVMINIVMLIVGFMLVNVNLNVCVDLIVIGSVLWIENGVFLGLMVFSNGFLV